MQLDIYSFKKWLQEHDRGEIVGLTRSDFSNPVAKYLESVGLGFRDLDLDGVTACFLDDLDDLGDGVPISRELALTFLNDAISEATHE